LFYRCRLVDFGNGSINRCVEHFFARLNDSVQEMAPEAVLTDTWWVPLQLYRAFPTQPIFLAEVAQ
jgi:hypothetical protein